MADTRVNAPRTARERARAELTREIKEEAKRQLASVGADGLSLRAVAKALGMVSSALYRYYPSRDDLLTVLIIDAYNALGAAAEEAIAAPADAAADGDAVVGSARARWIAACYAIRDWARANPHEYALIYGSPVPGYRAPQATVGPATRVPLAFVALLVSAAASGELSGREPAGAAAGSPGEPALADGELAAQAAALAATLQTPDLPPEALVRGVIAWTQLFGMISFELFGQFVGSFDPPDAFFAYTVAQFATFVGLS
ncbi:MAG TPA: TetR/AcrR family transcriptional regulator [Trebonia sp.]|nr:TetR/AcrR family transcriptional regulator [Trebonia sp.]